MAPLRSIRCRCGGIISFAVEPEYGRSFERCDGPCRYVGPIRVLDLTVRPEPLPDEIVHAKPVAAVYAKQCCEPNCARPIYSSAALRCREHADKRQRASLQRYKKRVRIALLIAGRVAAAHPSVERAS